MSAATLIFFLIQAIVIIQSPVNNSPPIKTIIIRPTGKTQPATRRARPTFAISCMATLLDCAPSAMQTPAMIPMKKTFFLEVVAFFTAPFMLACTTSCGVLNIESIITLSFSTFSLCDYFDKNIT